MNHKSVIIGDKSDFVFIRSGSYNRWAWSHYYKKKLYLIDSKGIVTCVVHAANVSVQTNEQNSNFCDMMWYYYVI